jgi:Ca2+-dependent lipid-binding protein
VLRIVLKQRLPHAFLFSGLQGIDLGSVPLIREWIQGVIKDFSSAYVTPKYVAIDLQSWYQQPR